METATADELQKISAMKMTITFFTTRLEKFVNETNAIDENLLMLLSHLTDSIQAFVLAAKIIRTNHTIESVVDKNILSCENIFECLACNVQTGKTYNSVVNHINSTKHIAHVKQFEKQKKQKDLIVTIATKSSTIVNPIPEMNLPRPVNQIPGVGINNNNTLVNGFIGNDNQLSTPEGSNYKDLFKMPLATDVVGFRQNVVSPSNNYLRDLSRTNDESDKDAPPPVVKTRPRNRRVRRVKNKGSNHRTADVDAKSLQESAISFLMGNFEDQAVQHIKAAEKLSSEDLYTDITMDLKECCRDMNFDVEVKCFGSRIIGIGSTKSDVDLNITVSDCSSATDNFLQQLLNVLSDKPGWSDPIYIKSRVSLVRARHKNMDLDCDITFNNDLAMANTKLVKYFYLIQPECQKLAVFVRMFTEKVNLHPQINTYTINLLVFFYFQSEGYLPKVLDLIEPLTLPYWPSEFTTKTLEELNMKTTKTFRELCLGFMDFYAHHVDFESNVLSPFTGSNIPKCLFGTTTYRAVNDCYEGLLHFMKENPRAAVSIKTNFKMAMCVQDPFSHDHNVSRCVGKLNLKRFKECCHEAYEILRFPSAANDLS